MVTRAAAETRKIPGSTGRNIRYPAYQRGCRSAGRTLFPRDILVLGHRHSLYLAAVHPDGPGSGTALSRVHQRETVLDADQIRLLQHGLPALLRPMVVLALVLLVVGELLVSQKGACLGCRMGYRYGGCFGYQFGT